MCVFGLYSLINPKSCCWPLACLVFQDDVWAERMVLAGAALVSKGPGLGWPGGPGWTSIRQGPRLVGGAAHCPCIPHCPSDLRKVSPFFTLSYSIFETFISLYIYTFFSVPLFSLTLAFFPDGFFSSFSFSFSLPISYLILWPLITLLYSRMQFIFFLFFPSAVIWSFPCCAPLYNMKSVSHCFSHNDSVPVICC